jgi:hypothetical protein
MYMYLLANARQQRPGVAAAAAACDASQILQAQQERLYLHYLHTPIAPRDERAKKNIALIPTSLITSSM